jgi:lipoprotein signal peptidase
VREVYQRLHTYAGLMTFVNLMVFGLVGLAATLEPRPQQPTATVSNVPFAAGANLTDRQIAEQVCSLLHLSLATPIQNAVVQHDAANHLLLDFWHANGRHKVTVLESEHTLRIEVMRDSFWSYLGTLHATTAAFHSGDWRMQAWADYNEFAMWCLIAMLISGLALWLFAETRQRWASWSLALSCGIFGALCWWVW